MSSVAALETIWVGPGDDAAPDNVQDGVAALGVAVLRGAPKMVATRVSARAAAPAELPLGLWVAADLGTVGEPHARSSTAGPSTSLLI